LMTAGVELVIRYPAAKCESDVTHSDEMDPLDADEVISFELETVTDPSEFGVTLM